MTLEERVEKLEKQVSEIEKATQERVAWKLEKKDGMLIQHDGKGNVRVAVGPL